MNKIDRKIVLTPEECSFVQIYYDCKTIKSLFYAIKENYIAGIALICHYFVGKRWTSLKR